MSHEFVKNAEGKVPFAFVGEQTWHGLGQRLTPDSPIPVWIKEAGFDYRVEGSPAECVVNDGTRISMPNKQMLYRSDTHAPLAIVGDKYKVVQPPEVLEFYEELVASGGFHLETAGVLFGGSRYFALAKVAEAQEVVPGDRIGGYLLLATACDGSLATTAQFTSVRVVCQNTLSMALRDGSGKEQKRIRVPHSAKFDHNAVKEQLGLSQSSFQLFMNDMKQLASRPLNNQEAVNFLINLLGDPTASLQDQEPGPANLMKQVWALYNGTAKGSNMAGTTAYGMLNAVTEYTDHHTGHKTDDARLNSAWFGPNAEVKAKAYEQLMFMTA
jgi:phage/plasmid-like protein (TIGR03299 family)